MEVSRQEYQSGLSFPPGDLSYAGIGPLSLVSPGLAGWVTPTCSPVPQDPFTWFFTIRVLYAMNRWNNSNSFENDNVTL